MTASDASMRARIAAETRWAHEVDRRQATAAARQGLRAKFEREVDPTGSMPSAERARRVESLFRAHMTRLSRASAASRRKAT